MEDLFHQFTILSDLALRDKNFDPSDINNVMKLFEIEAYKSWASMELELEQEVEESEKAFREAEDHLNSEMERAMDEFRRFEREMEEMAKAELDSLERAADRARNMGKLMQKSATIASNRYIETAMNAATASMKSAWKGISSKKVYPSWKP